MSQSQIPTIYNEERQNVKAVHEQVVPVQGEEPESLLLTMEDARAIINKAHKFSVGKDDPILCIVTLHNHFVVKFSELLDSHHQGMIKALDASFSTIHEGLSKDTHDIVSQFQTKTIENTLATVGEHQRAMGQFLESVTNLLHTTQLYALGSAVCFILTLITCVFINFVK